jgi:hypothetical protein
MDFKSFNRLILIKDQIAITQCMISVLSSSEILWVNNWLLVNLLFLNVFYLVFFNKIDFKSFNRLISIKNQTAISFKVACDFSSIW